MRGITLSIFIVLFITGFGAQYDDLDFSYITKDDGLSDANVECVFKDSDGFVWFGTRNGLCRYDGYEIKVYRKSELAGSISGNRIHDICEDVEGNLWIGTYRDGLNKFDKHTETFEHYGISQNIGERVNRIKLLSDGNVWVCSSYGLATYHTAVDSFSVYHPESGNDKALASYFVYDILETKSGDVYVSMEIDGIQRFNPEEKSFETINYKRSPNYEGNYRKRMVEDKDGVLWISANFHGLCSYDPESRTSAIYTKENSALSSNVLMGSMQIDSENNLWICTEYDGINIFDIAKKTYYPVQNNKQEDGSLSSNHTYSVYFDRDDLAWIGTFDKGVNVYNPHQKKFKPTLFNPNDLEVLRDFSIADIYEDSKGNVWVGTDGNGLFCFYKNGKVKHFTKAKGHLSSDVVTGLNEDYLGNLLIGTYGGGLVLCNLKTEKFKALPINDDSNPLVSSYNIWEVTSDSKNRVWVGLLGYGAAQYNPLDQTFRSFGPNSSNKNRIDYQNVMVIHEDKDGDIWFGTEGKGLHILNQEKDQIFQIPNDTMYKISTEGIIKCIFQDKFENFWIGTEDNGLFKYDKHTNNFVNYGIEDGLLSQTIQCVNEDNEGNLWIATSNGLFQYLPDREIFNRFIKQDGLSSNNFNADAMFKLSDGRIAVGTKNGMDIIDPKQIQMSQTIPNLSFTKLSVLNKEVVSGVMVNGKVILNKNIAYTDDLVLTHKDKSFSLEFAALNFTLPQKCEYAYKLEGFDEQWVKVNSDRRIANYTNLSSGKYVFKVKASNNDGKWGENTIALNIKILPPWWETGLFKFLMVLIFMSLVYFIYRVRMQIVNREFEQKQTEQEKKIIVLENEKLDAELKKLAFHIINKNKLLLDQKYKIQMLSNKAKISVKQGLDKVVESIDEELDEEKDWKFIEPQIDKAYNQFISTLKSKHKNLTATEIRIAAYIRMNLTTKEISEFMNKTIRAVENDRYRLRKKIGLETNDSIQNYLLNL